MALGDGLIWSSELDGNSVDDVAGNNGVDTAITYAAGAFGSGAFGNGSTSLINLGSSTLFNLTGDLTFEAWVYLTSSGYAFIASRMVGSGGSQSTYEFRVSGAGQLEFTTTSGNGIATAPGTAPLNQWFQAVVTKAGTLVTCYQNAVAGSPTSVSGATSLPSSDTTLGTRGDGFQHLGNNGFALDRVRIWNRALSGAEVTELFNGGAGRSYSYLAPTSPPVITSLTPATGTEDGGTAVTITGSGFLDGATVTFDGEDATDVEVVSDTEITCVTPAHAIGLVAVEVTNPDAQSDNLANAFEYTVAPPVFTKYGTMLQNLLPPGRVWDLEGDSELHLMLLAMGDESQRVEDRGRDLIEESDPRTATETISDWEEMVSLPDEQVTTISAVLAERRVAVTQKLVGRTGQNLDFYERLCAACGYPLLSLTKHAADVLRSGTAQCGESIVGIDDASTITLELSPATTGALTHPQFEAVVRKATHSHIQVVFTYT